MVRRYVGRRSAPDLQAYALFSIGHAWTAAGDTVGHSLVSHVRQACLSGVLGEAADIRELLAMLRSWNLALSVRAPVPAWVPTGVWIELPSCVGGPAASEN